MTNPDTPPILRRLLEEPESFSFGQAMRVLGLLFGSDYAGIRDFFERGVSVTPHLSLGFPPSDIMAARQLATPASSTDETSEDNNLPEADHLPRFALTATFLGLYGASSPLPAFYTEELLDDQREDRFVARDFLDIINKTLYRKYHQAHTLSQLAFRSQEHHDPQVDNIHYCLLGFGHEPLRALYGLSARDLSLVPFLARHTRSAMGLEAMVSQCLGLEHVEVEQCVERDVTIPQDQRCRLGLVNTALGADALLGTSVRDTAGRFNLHLHGLDRQDFTRLLPGEPLRNALDHLVNLYLCDPLDFDIILHLNDKAATPACLGTTQWQRLGIDTFLINPDHAAPATEITAR